MANGMPSMNSAGMGELFARLRFVLIALLIYRVGTHIPVPGIIQSSCRRYSIKIRALSSAWPMFFRAVHWSA
jgi:preprotein translocase subunit SecY